MADYPISNVARRVVYTGSAGVGPYAFEFEVLENTDINVYKDDALLTLTTDYTVTISALLGTGSITLVVAAVLANRITIVGSRPVERTTDFTTGGDFFANTLNDEMDSQTILVQQVAETAERSIKAPVTDPTNINMTLPINTSRAGKTLAFDADGNPVPGDPIGNWRGNWAASVSYQNRDIVKDTTNSNVYLVITAHTSSGALPISTNTDVAKWALVVDAAAAATAQAAAEAAQAAAETAETNAETSASNASTSESNASTSASTATTQASNASTSSSNAATSESNAATSASNASTSETNAAASAASVEPLPTQTGNAGKYLQTDGSDTSWEAVEALSITGGSLTGGLNLARSTITQHATTMDLWALANTIDGTGSAVTITAIANAPQAGASRDFVPLAGTTITNNAMFAVQGNADYVSQVGDIFTFTAITVSTYEVWIFKRDGTSLVVADKRAIFGYGYTGANVSMTNLVSNTGVVANDVTGVGTARSSLAAAGYGTDKAIFGYGNTGANVSMTNLVSNTGVVAADVTGVGTARYALAAAGYGTDKAIFGYGNTGASVSMTNLVSNTGVVAADVTGVGTARYALAAAGYGTDKAIFGYGNTGANVSMTNLVSNTGVVAADVTGVGTAKSYIAAAGYGTDKAIFGYGYTGASVSMTNLVSNTGVVAADVTGVGTARYALAAAGYGT